MQTEAFISGSVVNMRKSPSLEAEVVSQALFSEKVSLLDVFEDWVKILTPDSYPGWILKTDLSFDSNTYSPNAKISRLSAHVFLKDTVKRGSVEILPFGVNVKQIPSEDPVWAEVEFPGEKKYYIQKGNLSSSTSVLTRQELVAFSTQFLNIPYVW